MLFRPEARFDLAVRLRSEGAPIGEVYAFISELYFRGKLAYSQAFAQPPPGLPGALVIVSGRGLIPPDTIVTLDDLRQIASVPIDATDPRYREPLCRDCRALFDCAGLECCFVLLGSVATVKYLAPMVEVFGDRLCFPEEFAGRGDMSRGGLMLRCARGGQPLTYRPIGSVTRHGPRPPRLPKLR